MANTYTQIHIQAVFVVKYRQCLIGAEWELELYKYIAGIIRNCGHKPLQINGMPDHIHIFFGLRPRQSISDLMKQVKGDSSEWINKRRFLKRHFSWQAGYGAFSYTKSDVPMIIRYVKNQKTHHQKQTFQQEYLSLLEEFDIDYDDRYVFKPIL